MKKVIVAALIATIGVANAGLVAWQTTNVSGDPLAGSISAGWAVELFHDVNNDNALWQNLGGLAINNIGPTLAIDGTTAGNTSDDLMLGIFTTSRNIGGVLVGINSVGSVAAPDNIQVYTVMFNNAVKDNATHFIVLDTATFNTGSVVAPGAPITYDAAPGGNIASDAWIEIIPEPATFGLMAVSGIGLFLARKKTRS